MSYHDLYRIPKRMCFLLQIVLVLHNGPSVQREFPGGYTSFSVDQQDITSNNIALSSTSRNC